MVKKNLVLYLLIAVLLSACDFRSFPPIDKITPPKTKTPTPPVIDSEKMSPTGFYWPTKSEPEVMMPYLASGCRGKEPLLCTSGTYHTGVDIRASYGDEVVAIADGVIYDVSSGGWNNDGSDVNKGVLIKHKLIDGTEFVAIYGHVHTKFVKGRTYPINAGEKIGTIGDWGNQDHLHLTISIMVPAKDPYGIMPCPQNGKDFDTNGTVDPIHWLNTQIPGPYSIGLPIDASGDDGTDEGPSTTTVPATLTPADGIDEKCTLLQKDATYARLGHYMNTFFVIGDSNVWEAESNDEWPEFDPKPQPINLRHRGNIPCVIKVFKEDTLPPNYSFVEYDETIGTTHYHVEDFRYASALHIMKFTEVGSNNEIAVVSEDGNERCFADARQVLLCSELVEFGPLDLPVTSE